MEKLYTINVVEGFDPYEYLVPMKDEVTGEVVLSEETGHPKLYLPAAAKKVWFRKKYPQGALLVEQIPRDDGQYEFCARVFKDATDAMPIGTGLALRTPAAHEKYRPFESAQTLAEAKALESAGFGSEITLYLQMQEASSAQPLPAAPETAVQEPPAPVAADPIPASFTVPQIDGPEPGSVPEEVLEVLRKVTEAEEKAKEEKKAKKKAKKKAEKPAPDSPAEETEAADMPEVPEAAEEPPAEPDEAENPAEPEAAEEVCEDPAGYVVTATDVSGVHALDSFIGQSLSELGKDNVSMILTLAGGKISPAFKEAAEKFTEAA